MRTNHQLAKLKAKSLGSVAVFGNAHEDGIFSKVNTFGRVNPPKALYYKKVNSSALVHKSDPLPDEVPLSEKGFGNIGSATVGLAYFGSDPQMLRKEGGIMNSVTTFGNVPSLPVTSGPSLGMLSGSKSMGTVAVLLGIGYLLTR